MKTLEMISAIVRIMQQHGQHDFPANMTDQVMSVINLCGLTLYTGASRHARIKSYNIDMSFEYYPLTAANDEAAQNQDGIACGKVCFAKGAEADLTRWHAHLNSLHASFDYSLLKETA